jgi:cell division protein FtsQ
VAAQSSPPPRRRASLALLERLMAPLDQFRLPSRVGLYAVAALFASTGAFGAVIGDHMGEIRHGVFVAADYVTAHAGFGIQTVVITGHEQVRESDVLRALEIGDSTSLLTFNAHWARMRLSDIAWVKTATVQKLFPGTLRIDLVEREPYALWQLTGIVSLIDRDGEVIGELADEKFASLPLVVGSGANKRVDELMTLVAPHPSVATRLRAAVRVADRRWNLMLDNGVEIRLPETDADAALAELDDLTARQGLMARDIVLVDLRLADRVVVRLSDQAAMQRKANMKSGGSSGKRKGQDT